MVELVITIRIVPAGDEAPPSPAPAPPPLATRRAIDAARLEEIADSYKSNPRSPLKQVQEDHHLKAAQASRLIKHARTAGLIPPREGV